MKHQVRAVRIFTIGLALPAIVTIVGLALTFSLARTTTSVAVHWGANGQPDGYGTPYTFPILIAVLVLPLVAVFGGIVVVSTHRGPVTPIIKILGLVGLWLSVALGVGFVGTLVLQTGGTPSTSLVPVPVGFGIATVVAAGAWFALPRVEKRTAEAGIPIQPVELGAGERASWIRSTAASGALLWGLVGLTVILAGVVAISVVSTRGATWWVSFIPLVVLLLVLSNLAWTVRVDARGVRVRSLVGIPTLGIPLEEVRSAEVIEVHPVSDFGGWGVRFGLSGTIGIVLRSGEALEVVRANGRSLVITVDDAASAAALLNGLVQQQSRALS